MNAITFWCGVFLCIAGQLLYWAISQHVPTVGDADFVPPLLAQSAGLSLMILSIKGMWRVLLTLAVFILLAANTVVLIVEIKMSSWIWFHPQELH